MFDSIRSVTSSAVGALDYVAQQRTQGFSIRQWVRQRSPGVLFIPYKAGQIAALRSTISAWMRLAIFELMDQPEEQDSDDRDGNPLWFVIDELDALGQIDGLKDALARLRKFGGRCLVGFQSIAQVSSSYGAGGRAHDCRELRQYRDLALLRQRRRRNCSLRLAVDRRAGGAAYDGIEKPKT